MNFKESFEVENSQQEVWNFIVDPHKMSSCMPAVQSVEVLDDSHYKSVVKQKVGFISATFQILTEVLEKEPPNRLVFSNQGKTIFGASGNMRSQNTVTLTPLSAGSTEVTVEADLKLGGQLAILGAKLIETKSREIFAEVTENLKKKLASG